LDAVGQNGFEAGNNGRAALHPCRYHPTIVIDSWVAEYVEQ